MLKYIGLGTAAIGRPQYINLREKSSDTFNLDAFRKKGTELLEEAFRNGVRYFDTAPGYGMAEQLLIDWLKNKNDTSIELATKWGYTYVANFNPEATIHEVKEHSLAKLNEQWEISKQLLPFLTTYQIHSATFETGVLENDLILDRLADLKAKHNLLIGLSTTGSNQVDVLQKAMTIRKNRNPLFDVFQVTYNLLEQSTANIAKEIIKDERRIIIKEALANGRILPNNQFPNYRSVYSILQKLAIKHKVGVDAIALRFCIDSLSPYKVLSGASNLNHLSDNLKTETFQLSKDDIMALEKLAVSPSLYWEERKRLAWN